MRPALTYFGKLMAEDGYGRACGLHIASLLMAGANVYIAPLGDWAEKNTPHEVYRLVHRPRLPTRWGVVHHWPPQDWKRADTRWLFGYTMIEGNHAPEWMVAVINRYVVALGVPSTCQVEWLQESGVRRPIHVIPHGIDETYRYGDRRVGVPVFGTLGTLTPRKGIDILVRCFSKAFDGNEDVRLEIKSRGHGRWVTLDDRIKVIRANWTPEDNCRWYQSLTAYVSPTRGEGFGLTLPEAMRCGTPVIATNWSGPADYLEERYAYPLGITGLRPTRRDHPDGPDFGKWAVPDEDQLVALLRHVYEHQDEARAKGLVASRVMLARFPLSLPGQLQLKALEEYS